MNFVITITSLSYAGNSTQILYTANGVRADNISNISTYSNSIQINNSFNAFEVSSNEFIYKLLADDMYTNYCATFSLTPDPTTFVFLGLSIAGPFMYTPYQPEFVQVSPNK